MQLAKIASHVASLSTIGGRGGGGGGAAHGLHPDQCNEQGTVCLQSFGAGDKGICTCVSLYVLNVCRWSRWVQVYINMHMCNKLQECFVCMCVCVCSQRSW